MRQLFIIQKKLVNTSSGQLQPPAMDCVLILQSVVLMGLLILIRKARNYTYSKSRSGGLFVVV